ncbi:DUF1501 domain-containing protein [Abyssibacter profundi]|uniref:Tat pathway signal protein n=1 Tax=Abyssibacter profundi TaxID=2182787 RepID=A0A383XQX0_9GAMM|nr:DUF1501 domain-containing protein [Abyssibacter profundi]PWN55024.1 Tat pathway signal protein [Abyssibacter profundi]
MNRRDLLQLLGSAGLATIAPLGSTARAQSAPNRHFVFVNAGGGWDPTSLCDPKGHAERPDGRGPVNHYRADQIGTVGGTDLRYAPFPDPELATSTLRDDNPITSFDAFFQDVGPELLVINGIDTETNNHDTGSRTVWSGSEAQNQPALAALIAQAQAPDSPLAFISNGGYDYANGHIAPTRLSGTSVFRELSHPNRSNTNDNADLANEQTYFLPDAVDAAIARARADRMARLAQQSALPMRRAAANALFTVQGGDSSLSRLIEFLPGDVSSGLRGQAELAVAAFQAQVAVCANLTTGGFDTHGNHDRDATYRMAVLIDGVHHLWRSLRDAGIADRTTVLIGSDFGRTPFYNDGNGKDHWNATSLMAFGAGVAGGRVVGGTDANFTERRIDPTTLRATDDGGLRLRFAHVHRAARRLAAVDGNAVVRAYPLDAEDLDLFG